MILIIGGFILFIIISTQKIFAEKISTATHYNSRSFAYLSDKSLKDNVRRIKSGSILSLNGYNYLFSSGGKEIGFLAHEVKSFFPEAVSKGSDGFESVDYLVLLSPMVEEVKDQNDKLKNLKERLKALEGSP